MGTLTKVALGFIGRLEPDRAQARAIGPRMTLPPPRTAGGMPLMQALAQRRSSREFADTALDAQVVSDLLWAAFGVNRPHEAGRTAPSAMGAQEVDLYVAMSAGAIAQNVYLFCASAGLATVVRGWIDRKALAAALHLGEHEQVIAAQTVGYPSGA